MYMLSVVVMAHICIAGATACALYTMRSSPPLSPKPLQLWLKLNFSFVVFVETHQLQGTKYVVVCPSSIVLKVLTLSTWMISCVYYRVLDG